MILDPSLSGTYRAPVKHLDINHSRLLGHTIRLASQDARHVGSMARPVDILEFVHGVVPERGPPLELLVAQSDAAVDHVGIRPLGSRVIVYILGRVLRPVRDTAQVPLYIGLRDQRGRMYPSLGLDPENLGEGSNLRDGGAVECTRVGVEVSSREDLLKPGEHTVPLRQTTAVELPNDLVVLEDSGRRDPRLQLDDELVGDDISIDLGRRRLHEASNRCHNGRLDGSFHHIGFVVRLTLRYVSPKGASKDTLPSSYTKQQAGCRVAQPSRSWPIQDLDMAIHRASFETFPIRTPSQDSVDARATLIKLTNCLAAACNHVFSVLKTALEGNGILKSRLPPEAGRFLRTASDVVV